MTSVLQVNCEKLCKLHAIFTGTKLLDWITDYLHLRLQFVTFNLAQSSSDTIISGMRRGSVLGLLLFVIYINDVVNVISNTAVKLGLYDDDCVLYRTVTNARDQQELNFFFFIFLQMGQIVTNKINFTKTAAMTFGNKKQLLHISYCVYNYLSNVSDFRYQGATFSHNLKLHVHINHIS